MFVSFNNGPDRRSTLALRYGRTSQVRPLRVALEPLLLFWCKDHDHLLALHHRVLLDHAVLSEIGGDPREKLAADVLVHHLTAAEPQGYLGLVTFGQEADQITQLDLIIRLFRTGSKLHFLHLDLFL